MMLRRADGNVCALYDGGNNRNCEMLLRLRSCPKDLTV